AYCVAMFGIDGDGEAVRAAGRALGQAIRAGDVLYRAGAQEFAALLPEQALDTARLATERLRRAGGESAGGDAVSAGLVMTGAGSDAEALLEAAEAALSRARASGGGVEAPAAPGEGTLRLLVADDDPVTRLTISAILKREAGFELV